MSLTKDGLSSADPDETFVLPRWRLQPYGFILSLMGVCFFNGLVCEAPPGPLLPLISLKRALALAVAVSGVAYLCFDYVRQCWGLGRHAETLHVLLPTLTAAYFGWRLFNA